MRLYYAGATCSPHWCKLSEILLNTAFEASTSTATFVSISHTSVFEPMEDPIDWGVGCGSNDHSDEESNFPSSTESAPPLPAEPAPNTVDATEAEQDTYHQSPQNFDEAHEQWHIPFGEPLPRGMTVL
jgi:hypothetical protein